MLRDAGHGGVVVDDVDVARDVVFIALQHESSIRHQNFKGVDTMIIKQDYKLFLMFSFGMNLKMLEKINRMIKIHTKILVNII